MGPFESFYASAWQHPWLLWVAALAALGFALTRPRLDPGVRRYCIALCGLSLVDAWLTSTHVYGLGGLGGRAAQLVPLFFVLAGDLRFLLLLGAARTGGTIALDARALGQGAALTAVVPVVSQLVLAALPASAGGPRWLFLVYELSFVALVLGLLRWHPRVREVAWLRRVAGFVLLYYGLWAAADAILLGTGSDLGFALRVVPNLLYYGGLIAAIAAAAAGSGPRGFPPARGEAG